MITTSLYLFTALGVLPPASALSGMPTFAMSNSYPTTLTASSSATVLPTAALTGTLASAPTSAPAASGQAMVLSSALPPIGAKVVNKIKSGQYVPMKDLLADNTCMSLCSQLEAFPGAQHALTGLPKPRLREVQSPLTWVSSFLAYVAVLTPDPQTRDLLTYGRLVVREAQCHSGPGWSEYDKIFRQHAALDPSVKWNELNPSLHASTVLTYRSGPSQCCGLCYEPDHNATQCAMLALQPQPPSLPQAYRRQPPGQPSPTQQGGPIRRPVCPETLERICVSWNRGRCSYPSCNFRHICATCKRRGHKAKECEETPQDSHYKLSPANSSKPPTGRGDGPPQWV